MSKDFSDEMIEKYGVPKPINNYKKNSGCMSILGMGIQILIKKNKIKKIGDGYSLKSTYYYFGRGPLKEENILDPKGIMVFSENYNVKGELVSVIRFDDNYKIRNSISFSSNLKIKSEIRYDENEKCTYVYNLNKGDVYIPDKSFNDFFQKLEKLKSQRIHDPIIKSKDDKSISEFQEKENDLKSSDVKEIKNKNGFNRIYNESGHQEFYQKNGKINGDFKQYNIRGTLVVHIENWIEDSDGRMIQSGKEKKWWDDGKIKSEISFINGNRNGFGISYTDDGWIDQIDYYKDDEDITWDNDENKKMMLKEIKKYMNNGVNVYPVQYLGLCKSLDIDTSKFKDDPNFKIK